MSNKTIDQKTLTSISINNVRVGYPSVDIHFHNSEGEVLLKSSIKLLDGERVPVDTVAYIEGVYAYLKNEFMKVSNTQDLYWGITKDVKLPMTLFSLAHIHSVTVP